MSFLVGSLNFKFKSNKELYHYYGIILKSSVDQVMSQVTFEQPLKLKGSFVLFCFYFHGRRKPIKHGLVSYFEMEIYGAQSQYALYTCFKTKPRPRVHSRVFKEMH